MNTLERYKSLTLDEQIELSKKFDIVSEFEKEDLKIKGGHKGEYVKKKEN